MIKLVNFASEIRLSTLVCSSITVLLTACGAGNEPADIGQSGAAERNLAQVSTVSTVSTVSGQGSAAADTAGTAPAALAASGQDQGVSATAPNPGEFVVAGYTGDTAADLASAAPAGSDGTILLSNVSVTAPAPAPHAMATPPTPYNFYVSPNGNDAASGSRSAPFKTLARAARATRAGTTVWVAPGTYTGGFKTTTSGTASQRIYFVSTTRWGARIVPPASSPNNTAWDNRGSYVDIVGFQIDGSRHQSGTKWTHGIYNGGSYDMIRHNYVHHIATNVACTSAGGSAIGVDSYYRGVKSDVVANLVQDIGPKGCRFVQGIYISTSGSVKNNVVHRVAEAAIHLWHDANNVIITNNTVANSNTGIIIGGGDFYHTSGPNDYTLVYNNIVFDNKMGISEQGRTGRNNSYRNNLVYQNSTYDWSLKNGLTHTGTVTSHPLFVAYARTGLPNFTISSSSPAVGRGTATHASSTDFLNRPRNGSTGYDIGAYQH